MRKESKARWSERTCETMDSGDILSGVKVPLGFTLLFVELEGESRMRWDLNASLVSGVDTASLM